MHFYFPFQGSVHVRWWMWYVFRPRPDSEHLVWWTWTSVVHHFARTESPTALLHKNATCRASVRWCVIHNVEFHRRSIVSCSGWRQEVQIRKHLRGVGKHSSRTVITTSSRRKPGIFHLTWTFNYVLTEPGKSRHYGYNAELLKLSTYRNHVNI